MPGVAGVTLGGSRATGSPAPDSDSDIGVYYDPERRPPFDELVAVAASFDDRGSPDGWGEYGRWGRGVDGGVWLRVDGGKVDLIVRDVDRVARSVADAVAGRTSIDYQVGHPHGWSTVAYAGELAVSRLLRDPDGTLERMRAPLIPYPDALRAALIDRFAGEAEFTAGGSRAPAGRGDVVQVAGCVYRVIACLNQVLFAADRRWLLNEKGATAVAATTAAAPADYEERIRGLFRDLGDRDALAAVPDALAALVTDVRERVGG